MLSSYMWTAKWGDYMLVPLSQAIFKTYGRMEPKTAGRVAELLGFDPELVVPQLQAELKRVPSKKGSSSAVQ